MKVRRVATRLGAVSALLVILAACGSGGFKSSSSTTASATSVAPTSVQPSTTSTTDDSATTDDSDTTDDPDTTDDSDTTDDPGDSSTTSPYNNIDPYQLLQGTWTSSQGTFTFSPAGDGTLTTQYGGSGTPGRELTTFMGVNAGSGELDVSYDFASNRNQITIDEDQQEYVATRQ